MRRTSAVLSTVALLLLFSTGAALAGGGIAPGPNFPTMITGPSLNATILMDAHNPGITTTAGQASAFIREGTVTTQLTFQINPSFPLAHGCDLTLTNGRFLYISPSTTFVGNGAHLGDWVPPFVLESLLLPIGITLNLGSATFTTPTPVITQISSATCVTDPNPANNASTVPNPGWLLMNVTIQFVTLSK
jgi:hypothetical protein